MPTPHRQLDAIMINDLQTIELERTRATIAGERVRSPLERIATEIVDRKLAGDVVSEWQAVVTNYGPSSGSSIGALLALVQFVRKDNTIFLEPRPGHDGGILWRVMCWDHTTTRRLFPVLHSTQLEALTHALECSP